MNHRLTPLLLGLCALPVLSGASFVSSSSGNITFVATFPTSLASGDFERVSNRASGIYEGGHTLIENLKIDVVPGVFPTTYDHWSDTGTAYLNAGTSLVSYLFHFDPYYAAGDNTVTVLSPGTIQITFDTDILGLQLRQGTLRDAATPQVQRASITYPSDTSTSFGLELQESNNSVNFPDWVRLVDSRTIAFSLHASQSNLDEFRVLLNAPEPATFVTGAAGLALLALVRRRRLARR